MLKNMIYNHRQQLQMDCEYCVTLFHKQAPHL